MDANQTNASISFDMLADSKINILQLTYWGGEANERKFTISYNQEIGKQELLQNKPNEIFGSSLSIAKN